MIQNIYSHLITILNVINSSDTAHNENKIGQILLILTYFLSLSSYHYDMLTHSGVFHLSLTTIEPSHYNVFSKEALKNNAVIPILL